MMGTLSALSFDNADTCAYCYAHAGHHRRELGGCSTSNLVDPDKSIVTELAIVLSGHKSTTIHTSSPSQDSARNYNLHANDYALSRVVSRITIVSLLR